jgi:hypothetical protein
MSIEIEALIEGKIERTYAGSSAHRFATGYKAQIALALGCPNNVREPLCRIGPPDMGSGHTERRDAGQRFFPRDPGNVHVLSL